MESRNTIVIYYAWGKRNAGDHALILGALEMLASIVDLRNVVVVTRYSAEDDPICPIRDLRHRFPAVRVVASPFDLGLRRGWSRIRQLASSGWSATRSLIWPRKYIRHAAKGSMWPELASARLVLLNGGNLFFWHRIRRNGIRLAAFAFPLLLARRLGIPYGMLPQTAGPFEGWGGRWVAPLFAKAAFIAFRDSDSQKHVSQIASLDNTPHALLPDLAFYLSDKGGAEAPGESADGSAEHGNYFCVCLRTHPLGQEVSPGHDDPVVTEGRILTTLPDAIAEFQSASGAQCTIVVQVDHDRPVSEKLRTLLQKRAIHCELVEMSDPYEFVRLYAKARFLLSFRLHSLIFALGQGTPVVGIWRRPLGTKIPSMMNDLNLEKYAVEMGDATTEVLLDRMASADRERDALSKTIREQLILRRNAGLDFFRSQVGRM